MQDFIPCLHWLFRRFRWIELRQSVPKFNSDSGKDGGQLDRVQSITENLNVKLLMDPFAQLSVVDCNRLFFSGQSLQFFNTIPKADQI
jgi:hypothetical protein